MGSLKTRICGGNVFDLFERESGRSVGSSCRLGDHFSPPSTQLFPALTAEFGALSAFNQQFCEVISRTDLGRFTRRYEWRGDDCPPHQRGEGVASDTPPQRCHIQSDGAVLIFQSSAITINQIKPIIVPASDSLENRNKLKNENHQII